MDTTRISLSKNDKIVLMLILVFTVLTRFVGLTLQSLWYDELYTALAIRFDSLGEFLKQVVVIDVHPPLYSVLIYFVSHLFGDSELILRLPSAIFGVGAVWAMFHFGRMMYSNKVGLLNALFTAVFWLPLYSSQEARSYSLIFFITPFFFYCHYRLMTMLSNNEKIRTSIAVWFVITGVLLCYLYYYSLFIVVFSSLFLLFLAPKNLLKGAMLYVVIALANVPWIPYLLGQAAHGSLWTETIGIQRLFTSIDVITFSYRPFTVILFLLMTIYAFQRLKSSHASKEFSALGRKIVFEKNYYLMIFIVVPFIVIMIMNRNYINKYYSVILPALYTFISISVLNFSNRKNLIRGTIALLIGLALFSTFYINKYYSPTKCDYRSASEYIRQDENGRCLPILVHGFYYFDVPKEMVSYYFRDEQCKRQYETFNGKGSEGGRVLENLKATRSDTVWFITDGIFDYVDIDSAILADYTLVKSANFHNIQLWKLTVDPIHNR